MRDPDELVVLAQELEAPTQRKLEWDNVCLRFERGRNTILGEIFVRIKSEASEKMSAEETKFRAYADPDYRKYLAKWNEAEKNRIRAGIKYETLMTRLTALQSYFKAESERLKRGV